jgi:chemotaxis signal transduction protein
MDVGAGFRVAAGGHQVVEYLLSPETVNLPLTPAHCRGVMIWREQMIPVVDLAPLLPGGEARVHGWRRAVVLAYQPAPGEPLRYGALLVRAAPFEVFADDGMACPLPGEPEVFRHFACSCFAHDNKAIPILDTARLFARPLPQAAAPRENTAETTVSIVDNAWTAPLGRVSTDAPVRTSAPPVWQVLDVGHEPQTTAHTSSDTGKNAPEEVPHGASQESPGPVDAETNRAETTAVASTDATAFDGALTRIESLSVPDSEEPPDPMTAVQVSETAPGAATQETRLAGPGAAASDAHVRVSPRAKLPRAKPATPTPSNSLRRRDALDRARFSNRRHRLRATLVGAILVSLVMAAIVLMVPRERPLAPTTEATTGPAGERARNEAAPEAPAVRDISPEAVGAISAPLAPVRPSH